MATEPPRKRLCVRLAMPVKPPQDDMRANVCVAREAHASLPYTMQEKLFELRCYTVDMTEPNEQLKETAPKRIFKLIHQAWRDSTGIILGITDRELKKNGLRYIGTYMEELARDFNTPLDILFPRLHLKRYKGIHPEETTPSCRSKDRIVAAWMLVFLLAKVKKQGFARCNNRFSIAFKILNDVGAAISDTAAAGQNHAFGVVLDEHLELMRQSIYAAARMSDETLTAYTNILATKVEHCDAALASLTARMEELSSQLHARLAAVENGGGGGHKNSDKVSE